MYLVTTHFIIVHIIMVITLVHIMFTIGHHIEVIEIGFPPQQEQHELREPHVRQQRILHHQTEDMVQAERLMKEPEAYRHQLGHKNHLA